MCASGNVAGNWLPKHTWPCIQIKTCSRRGINCNSKVAPKNRMKHWDIPDAWHIRRNHSSISLVKPRTWRGWAWGTILSLTHWCYRSVRIAHNAPNNCIGTGRHHKRQIARCINHRAPTTVLDLRHYLIAVLSSSPTRLRNDGSPCHLDELYVSFIMRCSVSSNLNLEALYFLVQLENFFIWIYLVVQWCRNSQ
jgi:hypothetical protein